MTRRTSGKSNGAFCGLQVAVLVMVLVMKMPPVSASEWSPTIDQHMQKFLGNPFHKALDSLASLLGHSPDHPIVGDDQKDALLRYYLPSPNNVNVSSKCRHDVEQIINAQDPGVMTALLEKESFWQILIPDSWGKVPDGIFSGNFMPVGMMEECTLVHAEDHINNRFTGVHVDASFRGRYCMVFYGPNGAPLPPTRAAAGIGGNPHLRSGQIPNVLWSASASYGTCMPDSCSPEDFKVSLNEVLQNGNEVFWLHCHTEDEAQEWEGKDYAFVSVFGVIMFLVILAATADLTINYLGKPELRKGSAKYLLAFSGYSNMSKIFQINTKENPNNIACLHGIRVLSMTWVVWGHQWALRSSTVVNLLEFPLFFGDIIGQLLLNAQLSVDSFFYLSGLLVGYGLMRSKEKMDLYNFCMFYVHRFIRLAPPIAAMCFFAATIARFFCTGPLGEAMYEANLKPCNDNWFYDVLFINNLSFKLCLGQTWYTSVDMQIYLLVPLIFFPLMFYGKIGAAWLMFMTVISCVIPAVLSDVYGLPLGSMTVPAEKGFDFNLQLYGGTWSRMTPYIVGLWTGYLIYRFNKKPIKMELWQVALGWISASVLGLLVVFGVYPYNHWNPDFSVSGYTDQVISDLYNGFFRGIWGLALMWVVIACHTGYGGPVNSFLGHPSWQPLSRLTYGMFLTHIIVIALTVGSEFRLKSLGQLLMIVETCGTLFISGIAAVLLSLLVDSPIIGLEKLLLHRGGGEQKSSVEKKKDPNHFTNCQDNFKHYQRTDTKYIYLLKSIYKF